MASQIGNVRADDRGEVHLTWLVTNRSRNQDSTLRLFLLIERHRDRISSDVTYAATAQELAGVAFSLWRAVFLSDLHGEEGEQLSDAAKFLGSLIAHNSIAYPQDRIAREWSFPYYLENARHRLRSLASRSPVVVELEEVELPAESAKQDWSIAQDALDQAIKRFDVILDGAAR